MVLETGKSHSQGASRFMCGESPLPSILFIYLFLATPHDTYQFGQLYNGMYPSLWYYTKYFSLPPKIMATSDPFNVLHTFPFPEYHIVGT